MLNHLMQRVQRRESEGKNWLHDPVTSKKIVLEKNIVLSGHYFIFIYVPHRVLLHALDQRIPA
jgi:hypothetical protein